MSLKMIVYWIYIIGTPAVEAYFEKKNCSVRKTDAG